MIQRLVSGGQTGVDRAALDWALANGINCGGWCPAGRRAEDGPIGLRYPLRETPLRDYAQRTEWNVRDSDGTLLITRQFPLLGGTKLTEDFATKWNRPCLTVSEMETESPDEELLSFLYQNEIESLNVAGPRESTETGLQTYVETVLSGLLTG